MPTILNDAARPAATVLDRTAAAARYATGFYGLEDDDFERFRWMGLRGRIELAPRGEPAFVEFRVWSGFHDLRQHLTVEAGGEAGRCELPHGWWTVSVPVPAGCGAITLRADRQLPPSARPGDDRQLAVRVAAPRTHLDAARHRTVAGQLRNAILNTREGLEGRAELASTPTNLGIDMYGVCNVKPPCVYCNWDFAKAREKDDVEAPFNLDTLGDYGPFFENAGSLVNCSIGEPFMMKDFDTLLDAFGDGNKLVEMTTNGQILTDRNIGRLLGRRIELYVSLDAATAETYAKLRNDTFDRILINLRRLIAAKGGRGGLPRIHLVFMPMRVNMHELDRFVDLCADLDADRFVLRPLNEIGDELDWTRAGHRFVYSLERLEFDTLVRLSARAAARCRRRGVPFSNQLDFGGAMEPIYRRAFDEALAEADGSFVAVPAPARPDPGDRGRPPEAEPTRPVAGDVEAAGQDGDATLGEGRLPACLEPWKSLYVLRRGVMPCCYGDRPLAAMGEYRETWNAPILQDIRRYIARGEFHAYCLGSQSCPIVRKSRHARDADGAASGRLHEPTFLGLVRQSRALGFKPALKAFDQALFGGAGMALYRRLRRGPRGPRTPAAVDTPAVGLPPRAALKAFDRALFGGAGDGAVPPPAARSAGPAGPWRADTSAAGLPPRAAGYRRLKPMPWRRLGPSTGAGRGFSAAQVRSSSTARAAAVASCHQSWACSLTSRVPRPTSPAATASRYQ